MNKLQDYILNEIKEKRLDPKKGAALIREISGNNLENDKIAIIGIGLRMPQANSKEEFWDSMCNKSNTIRHYPRSRHELTDPWLSKNENDNDAYQIQGYLDQIAGFDAGFFELSSAEARKMNPLQRLFMECSYEALEDAGYSEDELKGTKTSVYVGLAELGQPRYQDFFEENDGLGFIGNANSIIPSRLSYFLGLEGTSVVLDSACSSGLLGVHIASESLKKGECNLAVVCGANLNLMPLNKYRVKMLESPESEIHPFGINAKGTVWGEGIGVVVLKRLEQAKKDNDRIYAVICGNGANNDGNSNGITAPKMQLQQSLFEEVWKKNHIDAKKISYIEAHGTGTNLGDPIEIKSLSNAFQKFTNQKQFCGIGTVKAGIGHLVAASGVVALIKSALSIYYGEIPPMRGFVSPNTYLNFTNSPFYISDEPVKFDKDDEFIAVNSFGVSGTNVHVVLGKNKTVIEKTQTLQESVLFISAKTEKSLQLLLERYVKYLENTKDSLMDICYSAWKRRTHFKYRVAIVGCSLEEMCRKAKSILLSFSDKDSEVEDGCLISFIKNKEYDKPIFKLAYDYIQHKRVNYEEVYANNGKMVDIPVYAFDEQIYWPKHIANKGEVDEIENYKGWVCNFKGIYEDDWMAELEVNDWVFVEHQVGQDNLLPATAMLNYIVTIASNYIPFENLKIENFVVLQSVKGDYKRKLKILVVKNEETLKLELYVYNEVSDTWDKVAIAKVGNDKLNIENVPEIIKIPHIKINPNDFTKGKIIYGERWMCIQSMQTINDEILVELELPIDKRNDFENYCLHPALLDMAINGSALQLDGNYLPFSIGEARILRPLPEHFYSHIRENKTGTVELISYNIVLSDEEGVIATFDNYTVKKIDESIFGTTYNLANSWVETNTLEKTDELKNETLLIFTDDQSECEKIFGNNSLVKYMSLYAKDDEIKGMIYSDQFQKCIIMSQRSFDNMDESFIEKYIKAYMSAIYTILKTVNSVRTFLIITKNSFDGEKLEPFGEAVNALLRSAQNEYLKNYIKHISYQNTDKEYLYAEICNKTEREVVLSGEKRLICEINNCVHKNGEKVLLKEGGYYLVTGGSGGLATILQNELIKNKCNIISVSRSGKVSFELLEKAEENHVTLLSYSLDITDNEKIKEFEKSILEPIGSIDGIFHLAGVSGHHFISQDDSYNDERVWNVKILASYYLIQLMQRCDIPLFVCYSSVAALIGTPGQSNYAAGNAFMDALVKKIVKRGKTAISIQWPAISGVGMANDNKADYDSVFLKVKDEKTADILIRTLSLGAGVYCLTPLNYQFKLADKMSWNLNPKLLARFNSDKKVNKEFNEYSYELKGRTDNSYTEIEKKVGKVWAELLEVEQINIDKDFYELGGNSITAIDALTKLNKTFDAEIEIAKVFQYTTIRKLSEYISSLEEKSKDDTVEDIDYKKFYEMSSEQKQIYSVCVLQPDSTVYNLPIILKINGNINVEKIKQAYIALINRHSALRTQFVLHDSKIMQEINNDFEISFEYKNIEEADIEQIKKQFIHSFDLSKAPLIRMQLVKVNENEYILMMDIHHIICDGFSSIIIVKDFLNYYETGKFESDAKQYIEYSEMKKRLDWDKEFWINELGEDIPALNLPYDWKRENIKTFSGGSLDLEYPIEFKNSVEKLAMECKCSNFMVILAAVYLTLSKFSNQDDIIVGVPNIGNRTTDYKNTVGMFVNTLPVRVKIDEKQDIESLLSNIKEKCMQVLQHSNLNYEDLLSCISYSRDLSRNPLYDIMIVYQNIENTEFEVSDSGVGKVDIEREEYTVHSIPFVSGTSKMDLTFEVHENETGYHIAFHYSDKLFSKETVLRIANSFEKILYKMSQSVQIKISDISAISNTETSMIAGFNQTEADYPDNITVDDLFRKQAMMTPSAPAVWFNGSSLSYQELNKRSEQVACYLQEKGIGSDDIVGVFCERSFEMIIGIYGIIKAGGAYMPIGTEYPTERIRYMMSNSNARYILVQNKNMIERLDPDIQAYSVNLSDKMLFNEYEDKYAVRNHNENNLCYVIYTSGTTGNPKGVMIEHHSIINRIFWMQKKYPITENDKVLQKTTYTFDVSVWEILWWSIFGASVVMLEPGGEKVPESIIQAIKKYQVNVIHFVPSMFTVFVEYVIATHQQQNLKSLKVLFTSGEELKSEIANYFIKHIGKQNNTKLVNKYGPTEAAVDVTYYECRGNEEIIPIGKPIDNIKIFILDKSLNQVPIGVAGSLYISGVGVARGYLNNKQLTYEKFVKNPFIDGQIMYDTGDLACWTKDGNIEYLGRSDHQVKIRGFRIELEEIEKHLMKINNVSGCLVKDIDINGRKELCAYLRSEEELKIDDIKVNLHSVLPAYMVPNYYIQMREFPLTSNGKINRKELPMPEVKERQIVQSSNEKERLMVEIWKQILHIDEVSVIDNFFDLGGDSIKAIQIQIELAKKGYKLSIRDIMHYSSLKELCNHIEENQVIKSDYTTEKDVIIQEAEILGISSEDIENICGLTVMQEGIFMYYNMNPESTAYFEQFDFTIEGKVDIEALQKAIHLLSEKYGVLRTTFTQDKDGKPCQVVLKELKTIPFYVIKDCDKDFVEMFKIKDQHKGLRITNGETWRISVLELSNDVYHIIWDLHHIIVDGWSEIILWRELFMLYEKLIKGEALSIEREAGYLNFVNWMIEKQKDLTLAEAYWKNYLAGYNELSSISAFERKSEDYLFSKDRFLLTEETTVKLSRIANKNNITKNQLFQAVWAVILYYYSGQNDIVFGIVNSGRHIPMYGVDKMVGLLLNTFPLRVILEDKMSIVEIAEKMKNDTINNLNYSHYPLYKMQKLCGANPLFDHIIVYQNFPREFKNENVQFGNVIMKRFQLRDETTYDFNITVEEQEVMCVTFKYNGNRYEKNYISSIWEKLKIAIETFCDSENCDVDTILKALDQDVISDDLIGDLMDDLF